MRKEKVNADEIYAVLTDMPYACAVSDNAPSSVFKQEHQGNTNNPS